MSDDPWSDLRTDWLAGGGPPSLLEHPSEQAQQVRRILRRWGALRAVAATLAAVALVAAVGHAANRFEAALAVAVGATIWAAWWRTASSERRRRDLLTSPAGSYVEERTELLRAQLRTMRFIAVLLGLELLFFGPWWVGGYRAHGSDLGSAIVLVAIWIPLAGAVGLAAGLVERARRLRGELRRLERDRLERALERRAERLEEAARRHTGELVEPHVRRPQRDS